jgi:periplasmic protein TonB
MIGLQQPKDIDEVVFSKRNKAYGAYLLRRRYPHNMSVGMLFSIVFLAFLLGFYTCSNNNVTNDASQIELPEEVIYEVSTDVPQMELPAPKKSTILPEIVAEPVTNTEDVNIVKNEVLIVEKPKTLEETKPTTSEPTTNPNPDISNGQPNGTGSVETANPGESSSGKDVVMRPDIMPKFPGGDVALGMFLQQNIMYPLAARKDLIEGKVIVKFVVNADGSIANIEIYKGIGNGCDEEAIRVVNKMPKWIPGSVKGNPVRVRYNLPINFRLQKK